MTGKTEPVRSAIIRVRIQAVKLPVRSRQICDVCGSAYGSTLGHDFSGDFDGYNAYSHWHICNRDGCNETDTPESHTFTTYVSNNDATYFADGTETATCDAGRLQANLYKNRGRLQTD